MRGNGRTSGSIVMLEKVPAPPAVALSAEQGKVAEDLIQGSSIDQVTGRLRNFASTRFKTLRSMYAGLDVNKDGKVSRDEFVGGLPSFGFPVKPEEAAALFDRASAGNADGADRDKIDYTAFTHIFDPPPASAKYSKYYRLTESHPGRGPTKPQVRRRGGSVYGSEVKLKHLPVDKRRAERIKEVVHDHVLGRCNKKPHQKNLQLMHVFRSMDSASVGVISFDAFRVAVGPKGLNLGLKKDEVEDLLRICDRDNNGVISSQEFIDTLGKIDNGVDGGHFVGDGQEHYLHRLERRREKAQAPIFDELVDPVLSHHHHHHHQQQHNDLWE